MAMPWLVVEDRTIVSLEIAARRGARLKGLLGRDGIEGAILIMPARSVHTLGMRFAIDVAHCDAAMTVLRVATMRPHRVGRVVLGSYAVIEAQAGSFERWGIAPGVALEVKR